MPGQTSGVRAGRAYVELGILDRTQSALRTIGRRISRVGTLFTRVGQISGGVAVALAAPFAASIRAASDAQEELNRFKQVFGDQAAGAESFAQTMRRAIGRSITDVRRQLSAFQGFFVGLEFEPQEARKFSEALSQLTFDFASFNNLSDDEGFRRILAAMSGSSEVLDQFGVNTREARLEQELINLGLADGVRNATEAQKAMARFSIISKTLGRQNAIGDAFRTRFQFANLLRRATGELRDLRAEIGRAFLPVLESMFRKINGMTSGARRWIAANQDAVRTAGKWVVGLLAASVALISVGTGLRLVGFSMEGIAGAIGLSLAPLRLLTGGLQQVAAISLAKPVAGITSLLGVGSSAVTGLSGSFRLLGSTSATALSIASSQLTNFARFARTSIAGSLAAARIFPSASQFGAHFSQLFGSIASFPGLKDFSTHFSNLFDSAGLGRVFVFIKGQLTPIYAELSKMARVFPRITAAGLRMGSSLAGIGGRFSRIFGPLGTAASFVFNLIGSVGPAAFRLLGTVGSTVLGLLLSPLGKILIAAAIGTIVVQKFMAAWSDGSIQAAIGRIYNRILDLGRAAGRLASGPLTAIKAFAGGIATEIGTTISRGVTRAKFLFREMKDQALTSWGAMKNAFASGDLAAATNVAWAQVKLSAITLWSELSAEFAIWQQGFSTQFAEWGTNLARKFTATAGLIRFVWTATLSAIEAALASSQDDVARKLVRIQEFFGLIDADTAADQIQALNDALEFNLGVNDREFKEDIAKLEQEFKDRFEAIDAGADVDKQRRDKAFEDRINGLLRGAGGDLDKAREEWEKSVERANAVEDEKTRPPELDTPDTSGFGKKRRSGISDTVKGLQAVDVKSSAGIAAFAQLIGGGQKTEDKILTANLKQNQILADVRDALGNDRTVSLLS